MLHPRYFKLVVSMLMLVGLAFHTVSPVSACTCSAENPPTTDALFVGTVIGKDSPLMYGVVGAVANNLRGLSYSQGIIFSVQEAWQGVARNEITVRTGGAEGCGVALQRGQQYFVQATRGADGFLHTNVCNQTLPVDAASAELEQLSAETTLTLKTVPRITAFEVAMFSILALLVYWWIFMLRAIRANPLRF